MLFVSTSQYAVAARPGPTNLVVVLDLLLKVQLQQLLLVQVRRWVLVWVQRR
jgi:hypothetical protein